jgi:glycosyltransferase involved in cell wall biosynthesis
MNKKLLIIIPDHLSVLIQKGEIVARYYNPGSLFDEVHIMMTNDDRPDPKLVQPMVGSAKLFLYNYPEPDKFFKKTLGWHYFLMGKWAKGVIEIARKIQPDLIRCYGLHLNTFLGAKIKEELGIPFLTSLHGNPDVDYFRGRLATNWKDKIIGKCQERLEKFCLKAIDHVIAVYSPIEPYLKKHKVKSYSVIHNTVGIGAARKTNWTINPTHVKLLCVGRQTYLQKDPSHIIEAIAPLSNVYLTLVGDGDLHHKLIEIAKTLRCSDRIQFIKSMNNENLLLLMKEMDLYVYHSINYEISKSCIEAALIGLPVILNDRAGEPAQEVKEAGFYLVKDSAQAYRDAITTLIQDEQLRMKFTLFSHQYALQNWSPEITEQKIIHLYKTFLKL